jgi:hypothetical protein
MYELTVEHGKIREFARATMCPHKDYLSGETSPPSFLFCAQPFWDDKPVSPKGLDFDPKRVLHASQEYVFHGTPPAAGSRLTAESTVGRTWEKTGRRGGTLRFAEVITEFREPGGALIAEQIMTLVETGRAPSEDRT